jgi:putative DNA primase/helicase
MSLLTTATQASTLADAETEPIATDHAASLADARIVDAALAYAARGWHVFPLASGTTRPITSNGFKNATTDPDQIRAWWTKDPDANIGVATGGTSGITVLDVDVKKDVHGDATLDTLTAEHGKLPQTLEQMTPSGGTHYVFLYAPGIRNSAGKLGEGLDVRGEDGYIVVSPSVVEEDGRSGPYTWRTPLNHDQIAAMPTWLLNRLEAVAAPRMGGKPISADVVIRNGTRNTTLASLAGSMRRRGMSASAIHQALLVENDERCDPPLDADEVAQIASSIGRYAPAVQLTLQVGVDGNLVPDEKPLSEGGDAERMVLLYGDRFRWVAEEKTWLAWDGERWARDKMFEVQRMARETLLALQAAGLELPASDAKKRVLGHALRADSAKGIDGMVKVARYVPGITVSAAILDTDPNVVNVGNGTLDLRSFELRPHEPKDMLTRLVDVPYEPGAQAPTWQQFLHDVFMGKADVIEFVQRCVGYTLTGGIDEQVVFFLHGAGANGKSTFVGALSALFGDYAANAGKETFLASHRNEGRRPEPELMHLAGKRFTFVDEVDEGRALDEGRIKALTGGETTTARDVYKTMETFRNTAKIWFDLNTLPDFKGIDYGIERRLIVIPFDRKFSDQDKDEGMLHKLKAELPGILAWAVQGCRAWRRRGLSVERPHAVNLATRQYRDEQNHLPAFFEQFYTLAPGGTVPGAQLQQDYAGFCAQRGEVQLNYQRKVVQYLRGVQKLEHKRTKHGAMWCGLARIPAEQSGPAAAVTAGDGWRPLSKTPLMAAA